VSRHRRKRASRRIPTGLLLLAGLVGSGWWVYRVEKPRPELEASLLLAPQSPVAEAPAVGTTAVQTSVLPPAPPPAQIVATPQTFEPEKKEPEPSSAMSLVSVGRDALTRGDELAARRNLSAALKLEPTASDESFIRGELARLGRETILSPRIISGDPLVDRYVIQAGDLLAKIAVANKVSADLLASVNGIIDKDRIREGQTIKIVRGPFRAVVSKRTYVLDAYLGDTLVRQFQVGLGADDSTPTGEWRVSTKLMNPTYYPPRGGAIIAADDPKNPLGERWIGLIGISGAAVDQERYGIHGTNEPDSIGKSVSMGCIRMRNEDVETLYTYLVEAHSTVIVFD